MRAFLMPHPPLLMPGVGDSEKASVRSTTDAMTQTAMLIGQESPEVIVFISPHSVAYADYFHISPGDNATGDFSAFGASETRVSAEYDKDLARAIVREMEAEGLFGGFLGEKDKSLDHGVMVPLWFIKQQCPNAKIVRISISSLPILDHYRLGGCIKRAIETTGRKAVIIASGDLSHKLTEDSPNGYSPEGAQFDRFLTDSLAKGHVADILTISPDFANSAAECGLRPIVTMLGAFEGEGLDCSLISYEGPFGVGYGVWEGVSSGPDSSRNFIEQAKEHFRREIEAARESETVLVKLARLSLEHWVKKTPFSPNLHIDEEFLNNPAGVFVSIKKHGNLRGCIGTIFPASDSIASEVMENAISAGQRDNRFDPVTEDELNDLVYKVDVLSPPEHVESKDKLDAKKFGVIVAAGDKRGVLLPDLEGIDTVDEQLSIALKKAGILPDEPYNISRFTVTRYS